MRARYTDSQMSTAPHTADPVTRKLIRLRHGGTTWDDCAKQLGQSTEALKRRARRLRDTGEWKLANGSPANGAPVKGKLGRPRKEVRSVSVSPRFSPEVADALRHVAGLAELMLGEVIAEALYRASARARGKRLRATPFGLERGDWTVVASPRTATVSVNVPAPVYDDFTKTLHGEATPIMTGITAAVHAMLADLGYRLT